MHLKCIKNAYRMQKNAYEIQDKKEYVSRTFSWIQEN